MQQHLALDKPRAAKTPATSNAATEPAIVLDTPGAPAAGEWRSPVYAVRAVPLERVQANTYNPNAVAPPEMELLETSIWEDGFTQPIVTYYDPEADMYIVVDGFHRYLTMHKSRRIRERERGLVPCVVIDKEMGDRMASTIRHNERAGPTTSS